MTTKSAVAVVAGIGANLLAIPVDAILYAAGVFPTPGHIANEAVYALALAYRTAFAIAGGWITARLAPSSPTKHALILGGIGVLFASLGAMAQWELGHHWYPLSLVVVSLPATLAGARLETRSRP